MKNIQNIVGKCYSVAFLLIFTLFAAHSVKAGNITLVAKLDKSSIIVNEELEIADPKRNDPNPSDYVISYTNIVALVYGREKLTDVNGAVWDFTVEFDVVDIDNSTTISSRSLTISHDDDLGDYEALDIHEGLSGNVKIVITDISSTTGTPPSDIRLELRMNVNRYDYLNATTTCTNLQMIFDDVNYENTIVWEAVEGAEEYELEWAYWDEQNTNTSPSAELLWSTATRIRLRNNYYQMYMAFPEGKVTYRVRPVGRHVHNVNGDFTHIKYGSWTTPDANSEIVFGTGGYDVFQSDMNWGYEIAFAEDGLRKQVIAYTDKSLTPRQVVTDMTTDDLVMVGEPLYDVEGRATASVLPVALGGTNNNLFYKANLNKDMNGDPYSRKNFDVAGTPDAFKNSSGASQYYSPNNPLTGTHHQSYIPDAEGYPMAQVRFKNDATGRPIESSGLGDLHKMGDKMLGEYTNKYFYGNPTNTKLRKLFGVNVGDAVYYERNVAMDANGQMSASYIDAAGRVVATSLVGSSPENVQALDSEDPETETESLIAETEDKLIYTFNYTNTAAQNDVVFDYSLNGLDNVFYNGIFNICHDCRYSLVFSIEAPDGSMVDLKDYSASTSLGVDLDAQLPTASSVERLEFLIEPDQMPCSNANGYDAGTISFKADFTMIGTYIIRKKLQVLPPDFEGLRQAAIQTVLDNAGATTLQDFIDNYITANEDPSACSGCSSDACSDLCIQYVIVNCPACVPGTSEYNEALQACITGCTTNGCATYEQTVAVANAAEGACNALLEKMKADFRPGGCIYEHEINPSNSNAFTNSAFNYIPPGGTYSILNGITISNILSGTSVTGAFNVNDEMLYTVFAPTASNPYQDQWADELVTLHPEYCSYQQCLDQIPSDLFDANLVGINPTSGWPGAYTNWQAVLSADPYFNTSSVNGCSGSPTPNTNMYNILDNYCSIYCTTCSLCDDVMDYIALQTSDAAEQWRLFRGIYFDLKEQFKNTENCQCYNLDAYPEIGWTSYTTDCPNRIVAEPVIGGTGWSSINGGNTTTVLGTATTDQCTAICTQRVITWMAELEVALTDASCTLSHGDSEDIEDYLTQYCMDGCTTAGVNPLCHLLIEDITGSNPNLDLVDVVTILNNACPGLALEDIPSAVITTDVYEHLTFFGSPVYTAVDPVRCSTLNCVFDFLNDRIFAGSISPTTGGHTWNWTHITQPTGLSSLERVWSVTGSGWPLTGNDLSCLDATNGNSSTVTLNNLHSFDLDPSNYPIFSLDRSIVITNSNLMSPCEVFSFQLITTQGDTINPLQIGNVSNLDCDANTLTVTMRNNDVFTAFIVIGTEPCVPDWELQSTIAWTPKTDAVFMNTNIVQQECLAIQQQQLTIDAMNAFNNLVNEVLTTLANGLDCKQVEETFAMTHSSIEHHYMLYYYDQAGNLIQTVSPEGVNQGTFATVSTEGEWDEDDNLTAPEYSNYDPKFQTRFKYNSLGQPIETSSPDGGEVVFYYDAIQRLRFTQNAKQANADATGTPYRFSYIKYDEIGRVVESGQLHYVSAGINAADINNISFPDVVACTSCVLTEQTFMVYDELTTPNLEFAQSYLKNRVSLVYNENIASYYDYDVHGNVKAIQHQIREFGAAEVHYDYELWSGNVKQVAFQPGTADQLYHQYRYDADNRLTRVMTSNDSYSWTSDARYFYYAHGSLARVEIGEDKVQGLDYYYSIHGWLKGINNTSKTLDPGQDGNVQPSSNLNSYIPKDEAAVYLGYYDGDYTPIGAGVNMGGFDYSSDFDGDILNKTGAPKGLFNGNIAWMTTHLPKLNDPAGANTHPTQTMAYQYDALHRIKQARSYIFNDLGTGWIDATQGTTAYDTDYSYDADGNISYLKRYGGANGLIDEMNYVYDNTTPNKLLQITDSYDATGIDDIVGQATNNYHYDEIGSMDQDYKEYIDEIEWNIQGKVTSVKYDHTRWATDHPSDPAKQDVYYTYDVAGHRLSKETRNTSGDLVERTVYVRDAAGNEMGIYKITPTPNNPNPYTLDKKIQEHNIYGAGRLGTIQVTNHVKNSTISNNIVTLDPTDWDKTTYPFMDNIATYIPMDLGLGSGPYKNTNSRGYKHYALSNHLGNVLATVSDKKLGFDPSSGGDGIADSYSAIVLSASDYYPFGWELPGRKFTGADYRFSVNGTEKSPEIGSGHNTTYFRELDSRTGRWWSTDPVWHPWESPYATFANNPIFYADPSGADPGDPPGGPGGGEGESGSGGSSGGDGGSSEAEEKGTGSGSPLPNAGNSPSGSSGIGELWDKVKDMIEKSYKGALYDKNTGDLIELNKPVIPEDLTPVYVVDRDDPNYNPENPWGTATRLTYTLGSNDDREAGRSTGVTGDSYRENHPLYSRRKSVTGQFAAPEGSTVYLEDLLDLTEEFNNLLSKYENFFRKRGEGFGGYGNNLLHEIINTTWEEWRFSDLVTDNAPFDIKSTKRSNLDEIPSYAGIVIGEWSLCNGKLTRYDDYGNFSYGYWGKAYGYNVDKLLKGAGINQDGKNRAGVTKGKGDDSRDSYQIKLGVLKYYNKY